ncbi:histone deacetylase family protein [Aliivibrio fischeri]|uniref:histone deacetylase family protein n=1 Tax=Aliivibrio fischeri TaxID=668 RepID=UPI00090814AC|nr:histone deacetylase [Aliivibrio fischeri]
MLALIYHPIYSQLALPDGHRYPIQKYQRLYQVIQSHYSDEVYRCFEPIPLSIEAIKQVHEENYVNALVTGTLPAAKMRRIGFPWSESLIGRTLLSASGTSLTVDKALENGSAIHLSGGYHHAHYDFGSGFCLVNDLVIAAHHGLSKDSIDKVLIIDSDVHHGDGTATLCADRDDIITLSFHCDKNFPARKPMSDYDVPLPVGTQDNEFLEAFKQIVEMAINHHQPDLIIYDAGVDIHIDDELGYLSVSTEGLYQRDRFMKSIATQKGIPIACVVGGGYRSNHEDLVEPHLQLIRAFVS